MENNPTLSTALPPSPTAFPFFNQAQCQNDPQLQHHKYAKNSHIAGLLGRSAIQALKDIVECGDDLDDYYNIPSHHSIIHFVSNIFSDFLRVTLLNILVSSIPFCRFGMSLALTFIRLLSKYTVLYLLSVVLVVVYMYCASSTVLPDIRGYGGPNPSCIYRVDR